MKSPAFSNFRQLMDDWDEICFWEGVSDNIKMLIDGQQFIMFFKKDGDIYGAPEESRLIFAKMKKPDEDVTPEWMKEASFIAVNLGRAVLGNITRHMFGKKDLKSIDVLDKEEAEKELLNKLKNDDKDKGKNNPLRALFSKMIHVRPKPTDDIEPITMIKLKGDSK